MSISELQSFCMKVREEIQKVSEKEVYSFYAKRIINVIDGLTFGFPLEKIKDSDGILSFIFFEFLDKIEEAEKSDFRQPSYDFEFNFCVFPLKDKFLVTVYGEKEAYIKTFENFKEVEEYKYYNNTDRPENVSSREWKKRESDWNKALCGYCSIPSMSGFSIECANSKTLPVVTSNEIEKVKEYYPSLEERINNVAVCFLRRKFFNNYREEIKPNNIIKIIREYSLWEKTEIGKKKKNNLKLLIERKIIKEIDKDLILKKVSDIKSEYTFDICSKIDNCKNKEIL